MYNKGDTMNAGIKALALIGGFCFVTMFNEAALGQDSSQLHSEGVTPYSSVAPPFITPAQSRFIVGEGDTLLVTVTATCLLEDDSDTQFELQPSTPSFVHVSAAYRREIKENDYAEGLGVVHITPQPGDVGKYVVGILVKSCSGKVERLVSFKVRVKRESVYR